MFQKSVLVSLVIVAWLSTTTVNANDKDPQLSIPQALAKIKNDAVQPIFKAKPEEQDEMIRKNFTVALDQVDALVTDDLTAKDRFDIYTFQLDIMTALAARGMTEMDARVDAVLTELKGSGKPTLVDLAEEKDLTRQLSKLKSLPKNKQAELARKYCNFIIKQEPGNDTLGLSATLSRMLYGSEAHEAVADAHDKIADHFSQFKDPSYQRAVEDYRGMARRLRLPGQELVLAGTTVDGESFDIHQLRGKVVLFDFWDIYCKACYAEFPRVKELYEHYQPRGFEVVGVSLDKDPEVLKKVLARQEFPWRTLQDVAQSTDESWLTPLRKEYDINAVPVMILVDADGKVISINARGEELERLLKEIFPDVASK